MRSGEPRRSRCVKRGKIVQYDLDHLDTLRTRGSRVRPSCGRANILHGENSRIPGIRCLEERKGKYVDCAIGARKSDRLKGLRAGNANSDISDRRCVPLNSFSFVNRGICIKEWSE